MTLNYIYGKIHLQHKKKGLKMKKLTNLEEAKISLIKWINETAEEKMSDIQLDDETGKTYKLNWDDAFEYTTEEAWDNIEDWVDDYDLTYPDAKRLETFIKELRSDTFKKHLDWVKKMEEEKKLDLNDIVKNVIKDMYEEYKDVEQGEHLDIDEAFKQDFSIEKLLEELKENELFKKAVLKEVTKI